MNALKTMLTLSAILLAGSLALANTSLRAQVRSAQKACIDLTCSSSDLRLLQAEEAAEIPEALERQLIARAISAAENHWPDTILEGPYETDFKIQVNQIEILEKQGNLLGYRLIISADAWEIESCNYDPETQPDLSSCPPGKIVEALFISRDLSESFVDEHFYAEFVPAKD